MITVLAAPGAIVPGAAVGLTREEQHHLDVLRVEEHRRLRIVDGEGTVGWGRAEGARVLIEEVERVAPPAEVVLAAGAGDKDRFLTLVEKAVELGVTRIVPLDTGHSRSVATRIRDKHRDKLRQRADQALKQSRNPWRPVLDDPLTIETFLAGTLPSHRWLADAAGESPGPLPASAGLAIAIGPEGGFTPAETALLAGAGFAPVSLGRYVLRFDTAAVAALALAAHLRLREPA